MYNILDNSAKLINVTVYKIKKPNFTLEQKSIKTFTFYEQIKPNRLCRNVYV